MSRKGREFDHSHYQTWMDPNELIPYPKNAKQHDNAQVKNIANSIRRFGWQQEAVVTQDNVLVIGHGRRLAALMLKCEMPVKIIDQKAEDLTDEDIRELRIADNKTNESPWDVELLADDIDGLNFDGFDFTFDEIISPDEFGTDFELPDGEKPEICQMTFTLHQEQKALIDYAISIIGDSCENTYGNTNKNGNALYEVVRQWAEQRK